MKWLILIGAYGACLGLATLVGATLRTSSEADRTAEAMQILDTDDEPIVLVSAYHRARAMHPSRRRPGTVIRFPARRPYDWAQDGEA